MERTARQAGTLSGATHQPYDLVGSRRPRRRPKPQLCAPRFGSAWVSGTLSPTATAGLTVGTLNATLGHRQPEDNVSIQKTGSGSGRKP